MDRRPPLDLGHLQTFLVVAKTGGVTRAAAVLDYAQSSVTAQIHALEDDLGVALFERTARGMTLTDAGVRLLEHAGTLVDLASEAREAARGQGVPQGVLTLGASESLCVYRLPAALSAFHARFPHVTLDVRTGTCVELYAGVRGGLLDVAVVMDEAAPLAGLSAETLRHEAVVMLVSPTHPLAGRTRVDPADLARQPLVVTEAGCSYRELLLRTLREEGVYPASLSTFSSVEAIKHCVMAGMGLTLLPRTTAAAEIRSGRLSVVSWTGRDFSLTTQVVVRRKQTLSPAARAMRRLLHEVVGERSSGSAAAHEGAL